MPNPCVIARLHDGLGNQMFQYAAARHVAQKRGLPLKLDLFHYESQGLRRFALDRFQIQAGRSLPEESPARFLPEPRRPKTGFAGKVLRKLFPRDPVPVYSEKKWWEYDPKIFSGHGAVYLNGYWQSEKYFSDIAGTIHGDFRLKDGLPAPLEERARSLGRENSVAVHVRRKDFVEKGIELPLDYYARAIGCLRQKASAPRFHFFSDDPAWTRSQVLPLVSPAELGSALVAAEDAEEMTLMSYCRYHIISNSTFSWWAAWLCAAPDKVVIAPKIWWKGRQDRDLVPEVWIRV